jgi:hypothetical protein
VSGGGGERASRSDTSLLFKRLVASLVMCNSFPESAGVRVGKSSFVEKDGLTFILCSDTFPLGALRVELKSITARVVSLSESGFVEKGGIPSISLFSDLLDLGALRVELKPIWWGDDPVMICPSELLVTGSLVLCTSESAVGKSCFVEKKGIRPIWLSGPFTLGVLRAELEPITGPRVVSLTESGFVEKGGIPSIILFSDLFALGALGVELEPITGPRVASLPECLLSTSVCCVGNTSCEDKEQVRCCVKSKSYQAGQHTTSPFNGTSNSLVCSRECLGVSTSEMSPLTVSA